MTETKFCVDCKHFKLEDIFYLCTQGKGAVTGINIVTGEEIKRRPRLASFVRDEEGRCKPEGILFEQKEVVTVQYNPSFFAKLRSLFTNKE